MNTSHRAERHVEFLGHHLPDGDMQPVAHIHLAEKGGDRSVGIDRDVGGQLVGRQRRLHGGGAAGGLRIGLAHRQYGVKAHRHADGNDQRAAGLQQGAAGEGGGVFELGHDALP